MELLTREGCKICVGAATQLRRLADELGFELAITDVDAAIARILSRLEQLCSKDDADQLMSGLLRKFDSLSGLSAWSDPSKLH